MTLSTTTIKNNEKLVLVTCPDCNKSRYRIFNINVYPDSVRRCRGCAISKAKLSKHQHRILSLEHRKHLRDAAERKRRKLTIDDTTTILNNYTQNFLSINKIHSILKIPAYIVKECLTANNIPIRTRGQEISTAARRCWKDYSPDKRQHLINEFIKAGKRRAKSPNKCENILWGIVEGVAPGEYTFTGWQKRGYSVTIGGLRPDFFSIKSKKKIIEFFGTWDHVIDSTREETENHRKEIYSRFGFDCLIIWSDELKNIIEVALKILKFTETDNINEEKSSVFLGAYLGKRIAK